MFYIIVLTKQIKIYDSDEIIQALDKANLDLCVGLDVDFYGFKSTKEILEKIIELFHLQDIKNL